VSIKEKIEVTFEIGFYKSLGFAIDLVPIGSCLNMVWNGFSCVVDVTTTTLALYALP